MARRSRTGLPLTAGAAVARAACNAITGLGDEFRLKAGADAGPDATVDSVDAAPDALEEIDTGVDAPPPVDGGCWADARLVVDDWPDLLSSPVPQPALASGVTHRASYDASVPGEVYDNVTRLTWLVEQEASSPYAVRAEAVAACAAKGARLPQRIELMTIQNWLSPDGTPHGADPAFFPDTVEAYYWTDTRNAGNVKFWWTVAFYAIGFGATPNADGTDAGGTAPYRCVRGPGPAAGAPAHRYEVSDRCGLVRDVRTRLEWERGKGIQGTYSQAEAHCLLLPKVGPSPWRMPTYSELESVVYTKKENPIVDTTVLESESAIYWTSTLPGRFPNNRIVIDFGNGDSTDVRNDAIATVWGRCVRDMD